MYLFEAVITRKEKVEDVSHFYNDMWIPHQHIYCFSESRGAHQSLIIHSPHTRLIFCAEILDVIDKVPLKKYFLMSFRFFNLQLLLLL
jgi:hypothetical protein